MPQITTSGRHSGGKPVDAVVIGGGIAGCTLAYELASRNVKVTVLEQAAIASESSGRNTGTLLSGPQKEVVELLDACVEIYSELSRGPIPFEFARIGHLLISEDEASFAAARAVAERYRAAGVGMEEVSGKNLAREYPRLGFKVAGGYFVDRAWTLEPMGATHAFAHAAREAGATIRTGARVAQISSRSGKVQGVLTDQGIIPADLVFIANGLWMADLLRRTVGDGPLPALPFTAGRGWLIQLGKLDFDLPWIVEELTWPDQEELGKRMSLEASPASPSNRRSPGDRSHLPEPDARRRCAARRLGAAGASRPRPQHRHAEPHRRPCAPDDVRSRLADVTNAYPGNRPMLSDGLPVAGRTAIEGLFVHGGMGSIGMHAAPATARWLVEAVMSGNGDPKQEWLLPRRFPGWGG